MSNLEQKRKSLALAGVDIKRKIKELKNEQHLYVFTDNEIPILEEKVKRVDRERINIQNIINGFPEKALIIK